jgi:hypothetical protein
MDLKAIGTLGVLLRSIRRSQRKREVVIDILRSLPEVSTLHIRQSLLEEIIPLTPTRSEKRPIGLAKGELIVPSSFFDPLPEDIVEGFGGGAR